MALSDEAILRVKEMILAGELRPGDRLPPEHELGERLGLSRSSLREAVKALTAFRVLDVRRGDGTYVTSLRPSLLTEVMSFVVDLHQDGSVLELMEVRRVLEAAAARKAATRMSAEEARALAESVPTGAEVDVESLVEHDTAFHRTIAQASGNDYLVGVLDGLSANTVRARVWRGLTEAGAVTRTVEEHRAIAHALVLGEPDLAEAAVTAHIGGVERWLRQSLQAGPE